MQVKEIMTYNPRTIEADSSIKQAAQTMKSMDVGSLPVVKNNAIVGMITDRDLVIRCIAESKDPSSTNVSEIMTPHIYYCFENDDIHEAANMMEEKQIHRLLVLNNDEQPVGFLALADFAVKTKDERLAWELLEKISEPAAPSR